MKSNSVTVYLCSSVLALMVFVAADFNFSRKLTIEADFTEAKPYVGMLYPPVNVNKSLIASMPVYFKVHLPHYYNRVNVSLESDNPSLANIGIAVVTGPEVKFTSLSDAENLLELPMATELKFALASEGELQKPIIIKNLKLNFERDWYNVIDYLKIWVRGIQQLF